MSWLDWEAETRAIETAFEERLKGYGPAIQAASDRLLERSGIGFDTRPLWTARFKPLTLLYPLFQAEAFPGIDLDSIRPLGPAHLMILVHAFLDDRRRDGQIELDSGESELCDRLLEDARELIDQTVSLPKAREAGDALLQEYEAAQSAKYPPTARQGDGENFALEPEVAAIVAGRAAHGFVATAALLGHAGAGPVALVEFRDAFDRVVIGLQWVDDVMDCVEDLGAGEENLLLRLLKARGRDPYEVYREDPNPSLVLLDLIREGLVDTALDQASGLYREAIRLQKDRGALDLVRAIELHIRPLDQIRKDLKRIVEISERL